MTDRTAAPITLVTSDSPLSAAESLAGGKGRNLYRLGAAGISTSPWAVVGTDVFEEFCAPLDADIARLLSGVRPGSTGEAARDIGDMIMAAELRTSHVDIVQRAYDHVGRGVVAVRSSGEAEDGRAYSFAGQFATFLGVSGIGPV